MICLDAEDGALRTTRGRRTSVGELLRELQPELVYVPFYLEEHADHRAASRCSRCSRGHVGTISSASGYEVWTPLFPNCLVRIDARCRMKKAALAEYASQLADNATTCTRASASMRIVRPACSMPEAAMPRHFMSRALPDYRSQFAASPG